jgi:hypothetical protein
MLAEVRVQFFKKKKKKNASLSNNLYWRFRCKRAGINREQRSQSGHDILAKLLKCIMAFNGFYYHG